MPRLSSFSSRSLTGIGITIPNIPFRIGTGVPGTVRNINILPNDQILIAGAWTNYDGFASGMITKLNIDGSADTSFVSPFTTSNTIFKVLILPNSQLLIGGNQLQLSGSPARQLFRLNSDGSVDSTFLQGGGSGSPLGPNFDTQISTSSINNILQIQDGNIVIGGRFNRYNTDFHPNPTKIDPNGETVFWTGFNGVGSLDAMLEQPDGKIVVAGNFNVYRNQTRNNIFRVNSDSDVDETFSSGAGLTSTFDFATINSLALQSDGKIIAGGRFETYQGVASRGILRMNSDGSIDTDFNVGVGFASTANAGHPYIFVVKTLDNGQILVGGNFQSYQGIVINGLAKLNSDGSLDTSFNTGSGFNNLVYDIAIQTDGKILVGGAFTSYNGTAQNRITRLLPTGRIDL